MYEVEGAAKGAVDIARGFMAGFDGFRTRIKEDMTGTGEIRGERNC
jgi:hypothetical protein